VKLQPNSSTPPFAVLRAVVIGAGSQIMSMVMGTIPNFWLAAIGAAALLAAIGMEMWVLRGGADDGARDE
jgi:hypothetical protein